MSDALFWYGCNMTRHAEIIRLGTRMLEAAGVTAAPTGQGFGMTLIDRSIAHELEGRAEFSFTPGGLHVRVGAPLEHLAHRPELAPSRKAPVK